MRELVGLRFAGVATCAALICASACGSSSSDGGTGGVSGSSGAAGHGGTGSSSGGAGASAGKTHSDSAGAAEAGSGDGGAPSDSAAGAAGSSDTVAGAGGEAGATELPPVVLTIDLASGSDGSNPQVAVDPNGNAVAAWLQSDGSKATIWANRLDAASQTWGTPKRLDKADVSSASPPNVAMDKNGNAFVVWSQASGAALPSSTWAARYAASGASWSSATLLEVDDTGDTLSPLVAVDGSGNAVALWNQKNGGTGFYQLWSNRYAVGTGWGARSQVETPHVGNGSQFDLGLDTAGDALAIWTMNAGAGLLAYSSRWVPGSAWTAPVAVESATAGVTTPHLALDSAGNAIAIWAQPEAANYREWGARYALGSGWQTPVAIQSTALPTTGQSQIGCDAAGNALALWAQNSPTVGGIWADANLKPNTWQGEKSLAWAGSAPALSVSPNGHAVVAALSSLRVLASRVDAKAGSDWGAALSVQTEFTTSDAPDVAVNDSGVAIVVWSQLDADSRWRIWAGRLP